nr:hypothetical protein BaRGS_028936 [Batillaria attramentaria]
MEGSIYSNGQIRYRFPAVGCQDAGLIRCEAPGASHNKTATLLVRCPPIIAAGEERLVATLGQEAELPFYVRLTGTPPDLNLTVRLDNVRKEEEGKWRLELATDVGTGHVDFHLNVMVANDHGDRAVVVENIVYGDAVRRVPGGNEEIPQGCEPRAEAAYQQRAAAPVQPAQEPSTEDDVYVPINEILARKRQAH